MSALNVQTSAFIPDVYLLNEDWTLFLLQLVVILTVCRIMCILAEYYRQPPVVFEILGGIILGPSVLGRFDIYVDYVFPPESLQYLDVLSCMGLLTYMFLMGLDFKLHALKSRVVHSAFIALLSIIMPFTIGIFISQFLCQNLQSDKCNPTQMIGFYVFISSTMSVTAFPVLARILKESGLVFTKVGAVVLEAAAINDAIAWLLLILAISVTSSAGREVVVYILLCVIGYAVYMLVVLKWLLELFVKIYEVACVDQQADNNLYSLVFIMTLCSGWFVSQLGLDPIIGSFVFGIIVPRNTRLHANCLHKMHAFFVTMFMPIYFAYSGLRTNFTTIRLFPDLPILLLLIVLSSMGKFLGAGLPAYYFGFTVRESAAIAVLMNTRGLVEFIVLNVGLDVGIVSERTFSVLIVMCLVNTFATYPLVQWLFPEHLREAEVIARQHAQDSSVCERDQQAAWLEREGEEEVASLEIEDLMDGLEEEEVAPHEVVVV